MKLLAKPILLLLFFCLLPLNAVADNAERDYLRAKENYRKLTTSSRDKLYKENWTRVIEGFLKVPRQYPAHSRAAAGLYMAGKASLDLYAVSRRTEDAAQGAAYFDRLAQRYPASSLADDALVLAAGIDEDIRRDYPQAYRRYRQVTENYPGGDMADRARRKTKELARYAPKAPPETSQLTGIRFWSNPGYTRVVLDLSGPVEYTANFLAGDPAQKIAPRLYVDLRRAAPASGLGEATPVEDGLLRQIRTGRPENDTVRVVLDMDSIQDYKVFSLEDPVRIVLDVTGDKPAELAVREAGIAAAPPGQDAIVPLLDKTPESQPLKVTIPASRGGGVLRRIVVDAGHGGKDPGAIGPSGTYEKDVTLAMAKVLAEKLKKEIGCDVILTRSGDVFLPLEERTAIANRVGADLFISLHANAALNREAYGIETYYLNFSKNDKAAAVAARENGTSLKQVGDLELILFDLMANSKINESSRLATDIQRNLVDKLGRSYRQVKDLGVRQGPFYVLLGATMPSVLVETAFISHPREEARLIDRKFHEKSAAAIVLAVQQYANSLRVVASQ
ncbi:MAG: N-acetylmuramoyl-L-alanine amidase [Desulfuromonadales bacterium]